MGNKKIPESTISRLVVYLREVSRLYDLEIKTISSAELGERTQLSDAQVRKDIGYFGHFGVSGSGYAVWELKQALELILGKHKVCNVAICGIGHLGGALLAYSGFREHGLDVVAAFDMDIRKIGKQLEGIEIQAIDEFEDSIKKKDVTIGIIAVPAREARDILNIMVKAGIKCILNFAPTNLDVPKNVKIKNVDFSKELEVLSFFLVNR